MTFFSNLRAREPQSAVSSKASCIDCHLPALHIPTHTCSLGQSAPHNQWRSSLLFLCVQGSAPSPSQTFSYRFERYETRSNGPFPLSFCKAFCVWCGTDTEQKETTRKGTNERMSSHSLVWMSMYICVSSTLLLVFCFSSLRLRETTAAAEDTDASSITDVCCTCVYIGARVSGGGRGRIINAAKCEARIFCVFFPPP